MQSGSRLQPPRPLRRGAGRDSTIVAIVGLLALSAAPAPAADVPFPLPAHAFALPAPLLPADAGASAPWAVVPLDAADGGRFPDDAEIDGRLLTAAATGRPVVLWLTTRPPRADAGAEADAARDARRRQLLSELRRVARAARGRAAWFALAGALPEGSGPSTARLAAYEIKSLSVTLRAEAPGAGIAVRVGGTVGADGLVEAYRASGDLDPYVDAVVVGPSRLGGFDRDSHEIAARLARALLEHDPGVSLWVERALPDDPDAALVVAAEHVAAGVDLLAFPSAGEVPRAPGDPAPPEEALIALARALPPRLGISPTEGAGIELVSSGGPVAWTRLFDEEDFAEVILFWARGEVPDDGVAAWAFASAMRRGYRLVDPVSGRESYLPASPRGEGSVLVEAPLSRRPGLLVITRRKVSPGFGLEEEAADVRGTSGIRVEEVVALHQGWRAFQDDRLRTIRRDGRITFRPRFGQVTGTADVSIEGDYFWEVATGGEWVIRDKYINGVRLNWDEIPEIPLVRWDQVIQAPLDLDLDTRYAYALDGREAVEGRECWILRFSPLERVRGQSLFRGRAWIDVATGALVRVESVQTGLEAPVLSREETRLFRPYEGPDGTTYWLLDELDGQILQSVGGSNLVILQQWRFGAPTINGPAFESERAAGYASKNQMLRDTAEGFRWLERTEDGGRVVRESPQTSQWFGAAGVLHDEGLGETIPLLGVNYVNVDAFDRGLLFNLLFAGVIANVTLSDPAFLDSNWDIGANLNAIAISATDRVFVAGEEVEPLRVARRPQTLSLHAGHPVGDFVKLRGGLGLSLIDYSSEDETDPAFLLPEDHLQISTSLAASFDRGGWGLGARGEHVVRSDWSPWGAPGAVISTDEAEQARSFLTWQVSGTKSWFLRAFQQLEAQVTVLGGEDLDRFSAHTFGFLSGTRLQGFGGSGIRYDRGLLGEFEYEFNLKEIVRFEAEVAHARVQEIGASGSDSSHTGVGFAASFPGPWQTLVRLDVGYALASDIPEVEGDTEFLLLVLRLF